MREWMAKLLGKELTKWDRLKAATGVVNDEDLLSKLIHFYADAKGIALTRPQLPRPAPLSPPPPAPLAASSRSVTVRVRPAAAREAAPSSAGTAFIVIHQNELTGDDDSNFPTMEFSDKPVNLASEDSFNFPMLMLREGGEGGGDDDGDDGDDYHPEQEDSDEEKEFNDIPIARTKGVFYRRPVRRSGGRVTYIQDDISRLVDGMLWRQAVLLSRHMPLEGVSIVKNSASKRPPIIPTRLPWREPAPFNEVPSEAVLLKEFGCSLCDVMGFSSRVDMMTHFWLKHPETREHHPAQYLASKRDSYFVNCALCAVSGSVAGARSNKLIPHVAAAHVACQRASEQAPHVCDVCHVELASEAERDEHVAAAHGEHEPRRYVCLVCARVERGEQAYIRHLRGHYTEFMYACNVCPNFRSRRPETMAAHTETHQRRTFRCGRCPFSTRTFRTLVNHIRIHLQLPSHICPVCGYRAYTSSRYFTHMDTHGGRTHRCEVCSEEFTSSLKKSHHKILVHRRPAKFTCDRCDITFKSSFRLRRHQASHTGYKPFKCPLCGKGLASRQSLTNHTRICPENDEMYPHNAAVKFEVTRERQDG